jgi:hypothetical protein
MAKATKSRTPVKAGSKPGAGGKPRKAVAVPRAVQSKGTTAAKPAVAAKAKAAPSVKPAVSVAGAKMVGPAAVKKPARPAESAAITGVSKDLGLAVPPRVEPAAPRAALIEPPQAIEREGTPPALPVPIASFTF